MSTGIMHNNLQKLQKEEKCKHGCQLGRCLVSASVSQPCRVQKNGLQFGRCLVSASVVQSCRNLTPFKGRSGFRSARDLCKAAPAGGTSTEAPPPRRGWAGPL